MAVTVGYRYYFGLHMGLCRGMVVNIPEIRVGDRAIFTGTTEEGGPLKYLSHEDTYIDKPDLFGGEEGEGGIQGQLRVFFGAADQVAHPDLLGMLGSPLPGYRNITTVFFDGMISAMNPYPKKWSFRVRTQGDPLNTGSIGLQPLIVVNNDTIPPDYLDPANIVGCNPVYMIFAALTNAVWGRGLPTYMIDGESFFNSAATLLEEKFGLCMKWTRRDGVDAFIQSVLDHVGATLYTDRSTGLLKIKLLRNDYDVETLPLFSQELGVCEITEATVVANGPLINEVKVVYRDPITNEDRIAVARNPAAVQSDGQAINSQTKQYPGIPTGDIAARVAQRDLKSMGAHLRRFTIKMNRIAWKVVPGQVFKIQDISRGITPVVVRVGAIEDGGLGQGGVTLRCVQDVFALPATTFSDTEPPRWQPPSNKPCLPNHAVFEMPYFLIARTLPAADFNLLGEEASFVGALCEKGQPLNIAYRIATRPDAPTIDDDPAEGYYCEGYTPP